MLVSCSMLLKIDFGVSDFCSILPNIDLALTLTFPKIDFSGFQSDTPE